MAENSRLPCLYCGERHRFLSGPHFQREDHFGDRQDAFHEKYKGWVAETYDIDPDDTVLTDPGELTRPEGWERNKHRFPDWQSRREI